MQDKMSSIGATHYKGKHFESYVFLRPQTPKEYDLLQIPVTWYPMFTNDNHIFGISQKR